VLKLNVTDIEEPSGETPPKSATIKLRPLATDNFNGTSMINIADQEEQMTDKSPLLQGHTFEDIKERLTIDRLEKHIDTTNDV
jgi:hypothetical protein